ncbi:PEP-CTERM sorting domain-containing protein [Rhodoferax ferrireducens]|uniref:PEP-CTERM sorting domain-containing protein n=1 Tax=Rhodoferax ferrireducens TaxID=192843 RepID=UPI00298EA777|nr:PEP-CTERM sorting domain-containing protein [Rhodoferax ferrireducens]WPC66009.1 PEP-CTERM sorting domain-containing protein [Rhodoferax ferrireducens]
MKMHIKALAVAAMTAVASLAATAAPLDTLAGSYNWKLQGTTSEYSPVAYGTTLAESTWGIGEITDIKKTNGDPAWTSGLGGDYLYFMIYGIADLQVTPVLSGFNIYNVGCTGGVGCDGKIHIDIYRMSSPISSILQQDPDNRLGFNGFNGLTNAAGASLYLGLEMMPGKVVVDDPATVGVDERTATMFQNANANTLPTTGAGTFFAEATSGSGMAQWNSNGFALPGGLFADFDSNFTLKPNLVAAGGACPNGSLPDQCFLGLINDPVQSNAIPEPGSLALVGLALAAFGVIRRRDNKK